MNKIILILIAILLPPLAVFLKQNEFGRDVLINLVLCLFFWVPGILHALWIITR